MSIPPVDPPDERRRFGALTERLGLKAMALLLSVLLWFAVGLRSPAEGHVTVRVEPQLDSSLAMLEEAPHVRALVAGRSADLMKLYAAPPVVHHAVAGDTPDTLVLDLTPADVQIPADLVNDVRVLDVQPRRVVLRFGRANRAPESTLGAPRRDR